MNGVPSSPAHVEWWECAGRNLDRWGEQSPETLLLAMQEELGELTQAYLEAEHEDGDHEAVATELVDLAALCFQLQWRIESKGWTA